MKIVMFTNTYLPHVGGVARSVESFTAAYRKMGHEVMIVAPEFDDQPTFETNVVRIPALQDFNGSDFSVVLPIAGFLMEEVETFDPDILHAHHPFLLGNTAARLARVKGLPLVFTHHTLYEQYTHYVPADSSTMKRFAVELAIAYTNLCDAVFAPSESIAALLRQRGTRKPIEVVPTGVDVDRFGAGDGKAFRQARGIPEDSIVVGHLGRLAREKNLDFLTEALALFAERTPNAIVLIVGKGPAGEMFDATFERRGLQAQLRREGILGPEQLPDCYAAMDVFAFASKSETQGMVLTEAMAAGTPVVGLDAAGVREVVEDERNGRLLFDESPETFASALSWVVSRDADERASLRAAATQTAQRFSMENCAQKALRHYSELIARGHRARPDEHGLWFNLAHTIQAEWDLLSADATALRRALYKPSSGE